jgi:hypothetical protein
MRQTVESADDWLTVQSDAQRSAMMFAEHF